MENSNNKSFVGIGLSLVAIVLAATALFVGINLLSKQKASETGLTEKSDKAMALAVESKAALDQIEELKAELEKLKKRLGYIEQGHKSDVSKLGGSIERLEKNMKGGFEHYSTLMTENRDLIIANQDAIKELATRGVQAPKPVPTPVESTYSDGEEIDGDYIIYTIKSNDYFSKLAKQFNVTVEAIEAANPNVSSNKLQIGQKINIPVAQ